MQVIRSFVREAVQAYKQKDKNAICDLISLDSSSERVEQLSQVLYDVSATCYKLTVLYTSPGTKNRSRSDHNVSTWTVAAVVTVQR